MAGLSRRSAAKYASMSARRSTAKRQGLGAKRSSSRAMGTIVKSLIARRSTPQRETSSLDRPLAAHDRLAADRGRGKAAAAHRHRQPDQARPAHLVALLDVE